MVVDTHTKRSIFLFGKQDRSSPGSDSVNLYGARATGVAPGTKSIWNSTCRVGGSLEDITDPSSRIYTLWEANTRKKESVESESLKSSTQNSSVNDFVVINIPEEDVEPKQIILDPDDQPMWESAKTVAPTPNSAIIQLDVDDNFVINSTHLKMILENKFDGYLLADPHDHIHEFLAICDMFKYGKTQSEDVKLLIFPFSLCDKAKT
ncbi:hypothetical protein Tco_1023640 [Tanacetum coccineum]